jgi:hypothetical protein
MKIMAAVIALGLSGPAMAQDTGTIRFLGAGMNCFKIQVEKSGLNYAVDYASTAIETAMGWINIFSDSFGNGTVMTIETDGTQPKDCGDGTFYRIIGLALS